eukprot:m.82197 g.82197  ORF g.82197 m.82197 type:complete len:530 (-) comp14902_c0_seq3:315-1904(-)
MSTSTEAAAAAAGEPRDAASATTSAAAPSTSAAAAKKEVMKLHRSFNPFENNRAEPGVVEWIKMILLFPTLGLLRVVLAVLILLIVMLWAWICTIGVGRSQDPLPEWRRKLAVPVIAFLARALLFVFGFYYINVKGDMTSVEDAPLLVCNHISYFEPLFFTTYGVSHVGKAEVAKTPFVGGLFKALQILLVDRMDKQSRSDVRAAIELRAKTQRGKWPKLCIYPEGTITNGKAVIQFKHGAFQPNVPVQPAVVSFSYIWMDPSTTNGAQFYWVRFLSQIYHIMEVDFLPVHTPSADEQANTSLFAENVRDTMATALKVSKTNHQLGDLLLQRAAMKHRLPWTVGVVEFGDLNSLFKLSIEDAQTFLDRFSKLDVNQDGRLGLEEFAKGLNMPADSDIAVDLFHKFDKDEDGFLDFREFIAGLMFIVQSVEDSKTIDWMFDIIDSDHDNSVSLSELADGLRTAESEDIDAAGITKALTELKDKDAVSREEFTAFMKKHPEIMTAPRRIKVLENFKLSLANKFTNTHRKEA